MQTNSYNFSGDLLKKIRKTLGFRQHEIVGNEVTRNLISLIESNKVRLNESTANILLRNMNRLASERNLEIELDQRDLRIPGMFEAKQTADNYIKTLRNNLESESFHITEYIQEINIFLSNWDLSHKKATIYEILGDYYYEKIKFYNSYIYYIKSFESALRFSDTMKLADIVLKIMRTCIRLNRYQETLDYSNIIIVHKDEISNDVFIKISYNRAMVYKYLSDFDSCLKEIAKIEPIIDKIDFTTYLYTMTLKAICYKKMEKYSEALIVYHMLLKLLSENDVENKIIVLTNIMEIHRFTKQDAKILESLELVISLLTKLDKTCPYLPQIELEIAFTYEYLENYILAENYLINSLNHAKSIKDLDTIKKVVTKLLKFYIDSDLPQIDEFKDEILFLVENRLLELDNPSILLLISYYNKVNKSEELDRIIKQLLNIKGDELNEE